MKRNIGNAHNDPGSRTNVLYPRFSIQSKKSKPYRSLMRSCRTALRSISHPMMPTRIVQPVTTLAVIMASAVAVNPEAVTDMSVGAP
jgi:hypothetical protein